MVVFKYIEDKDVFQKFYSKMLAKRLVQHMSASDDAEASMISKLKSACGFEYTSKLQRMFQDIGVSKDLNEQLKGHLKTEPLDIDFSIQVRDPAQRSLEIMCKNPSIMSIIYEYLWMIERLEDSCFDTVLSREWIEGTIGTLLDFIVVPLNRCVSLWNQLQSILVLFDEVYVLYFSILSELSSM